MPVIDEAVALLDVSVCQPERCPDECDDQEDAVFVAVSANTEGDTNSGACYLYTNIQGGDLDQWSDPITLSNWGTTAGEHADAVTCLGEFVVIASTTAGEIIYTDDLGTTQVVVAVADWLTNGPTDVDAIDQTFVVMCHENGHVYGSVDGARTWEVLDDAQASVLDFERVMIARDNAEVIYIVGCANTTTSTGTMIKSVNAGDNWAALTDPRSGETSFCYTALWVANQTDVIVGCSDGEIWETEDGGVTWAQQLEPPGFPSPSTSASISDITGCGCGVLLMAVAATTISESVIYRNVDGGASGKWYIPSEGDSLTQPPLAVACAGPNLAVAVGGVINTTSGSAVLLA